MSGTALVAEIVSILVAGIQGLGTGIGAGISNFATALAFTGTGSDQTMSVFFVLVCVFAAIGLAVGLTQRIFNWLAGLGGSH